MASTQTETRIIEVKVTSTGEASLKALQTQLDAVAKQYDKASVSTLKMNKASQEADKQLRSNRTAWVGLGQQMQDSVVQLQMGTSAMTVLIQQGSQAAFMLQGLKGAAGGVARFFSGPWGAAIIAAVAVLGPLISGLGDTNEKLGGLNQQEFDRLRKELGATAKELKKVDDLTVTWGDSIKALGQIIDEYMGAEIWAGIGEFISDIGRIIKTALIIPLQAVAALILGLAKTGKELWSKGFDGAKNVGKNINDAWIALGKLGAVASDIRDARVGAALEKDTEKAKKAAKETKDEFAELLAIWRQGGPELAKLKKEFSDLKRVFKIIEGVDWDENTANSSRLGETLRSLYNQIRALESPFQALQVEFENLTSETDKLNTRFNMLMGIVNDMAQDPAFRNWAAQQALDIATKLMPELKAVTDQVDAYYTKIRGITTTANAGGSEKEGLLQRKKELEASQRGVGGEILTPEGAKVVAEEMRKINVELAKMELSPAQLEGFNLLVETIDQLGDAFAQAIENGESLKKAFKEVAKSVVRELVKIIVKLLIIKALQSAFPGSQFIGAVNSELFPKAKGGAFVNGVQKFAKGGVVGAPTLFGMRGGLGVMGEAGPEAVMPLARGSDGKLGVAAAPVNIQIINNAGVAVSTRTEEDRTVIVLEAVEQARKMITSDIRRGGNPVARSIEGTYGVSRAR